MDIFKLGDKILALLEAVFGLDVYKRQIEGDRVNTAIDGLIEKVGMFAMEKKAISVDHRSALRTEEQLAGIRASAKINTALLDYLSENIREGMSTAEIDHMVEAPDTRDRELALAADRPAGTDHRSRQARQPVASF